MKPLIRIVLAGFVTALLLARGASAYTLGMLPPADPDDGQTFRVLCIHDVRDNLRQSFATLPDAYAIDTTTLTNIFAWLHANGYHPVRVADIVAARNGGPRLPSKPILLTFDDGYKSTYTKVFPLLREFNYPALLAPVTAWIDTPPGQPIAISDTLKVPRDFFMNWDDIRDMVASGLVDLASHTDDMHHGEHANPQGNELPAASAHLYLPSAQRYETDEEYRHRIRADLKKSVDEIFARTGVTVRSIVWPYGAYNTELSSVARDLGMTVQFTLESGPNSPDVPLSQVRRILLSYDTNVGSLARELREPATYRGRVHPIERVVQVDLDYVYDPDPRQQERNLSRLIDRIKDLAPRSVYLQAYADPKGEGVAEALYFPNRHMPMRADLFSRVAWQLITRANVHVYAWMPVLAFRLPSGDPAAGHQVVAAPGTPVAHGNGRPQRLSPFDPQARQAIKDIYEDLAKHASFDGVLFGDDATLDDYEDASPAALRTYASWGLPADVGQIRASPATLQRWTKDKTHFLIEFTQELAQILRSYQQGQEFLTVRNLFARPVIDPASETWFAQNLDDFVASYDYVALMAMPYMEDAASPSKWLDRLAAAVAARPGAMKKTLFELQAKDWRTGKPVDTAVLLQQMKRLRLDGALHLGYYPDNFIDNHPDTEVLRDVMSLKETIEERRPLDSGKSRALVLRSEGEK